MTRLAADRAVSTTTGGNGMLCNALHPDYIELREVTREVQREIDHKIINHDGTIVIVTELVTDTIREIVEKPGSHPLGGPVQCRRLPGHFGDHAAYVFSIRNPETWPDADEPEYDEHGEPVTDDDDDEEL
jgi:hypothetical protein